MNTSCAPFSCNNFANITYPFWNFNIQPRYYRYLEFKLDCLNANFTIEMKSQNFHILHLNQTFKLFKVSREDFYDLDANHKIIVLWILLM